jgi:hypothetical protein
MARRHSSSARIATEPVVNRLGFPATMWLGCRATVWSSVKGAGPGSPTCARIRSTAGLGAATKSS